MSPHRYTLRRRWMGDGKTVNWIMLNPSTADEVVDCDYPLPGNPPGGAQSAAFQTKDLTCYMMTYRKGKAQ